MIGLDDLQPLLGRHLAAQRWYDGSAEPQTVEVVAAERWLDGDPSLWWLLVDADVADGGPPVHYQLVIGARGGLDHAFLHGKSVELLGTVDTDGGPVSVYDAVIDPALALEILVHSAPELSATSARPLAVEQTNTSLVFDEHLILKLFRRVHPGPNPDVEVVSRLLEHGFSHVPSQRAVLERDGAHLAVVREFLTGSSDGWQLAETSLRVLFADHETAATSGGDFAPEARRIGALTAELHLALAAAFPPEAGDLRTWVEHFHTQLDRVRPHVPAEAIAARYDRLTALNTPVRACRVHGDLHLGQLLRADSGWYVLDFEGEPARPVAERVRPSSPLRDVAGMLRSFHYASEVASLERGKEHAEIPALAVEWENHVRAAFLDGYFDVNGIDALLPDQATTAALLDAFELDKAVYEVAYEVAYRPTWVEIPRRGIERLLR